MSEKVLEAADMADPFSSTRSGEVGGGGIVAETLIGLARQRHDIVLVAPDLGRAPATMPFVEAFPDRFVDVGIAETNSVSLAAGLAASGFRPFVLGMGAFLAPKCLEQIRTDVSINHLPVVMISAWGGIDMGYFGPSHLGIEDIAQLRATPDLDIAFAADGPSMRAIMLRAVESGHPTYIRAPSTSGTTPVYGEAEDLELAIGQLREVADGSEVLLVGTGMGTGLCVQAAEVLHKQGLSVAVTDAIYLKPFDADGICRLARGKRLVLTVEEHNVAAGLGSLVAEALGRGGVSVPLATTGFPDGDLAVAVPGQLYERYGLTVDGIVAAVRSRLPA